MRELPANARDRASPAGRPDVGPDDTSAAGHVEMMACTPELLPQKRAAARVKALLLSHSPPDLVKANYSVLLSANATYSGSVRLAEDCMRIDLSSP
jgi:hypothetical protein